MPAKTMTLIYGAASDGYRTCAVLRWKSLALPVLHAAWTSSSLTTSSPLLRRRSCGTCPTSPSFSATSRIPCATKFSPRRLLLLGDTCLCLRWLSASLSARCLRLLLRMAPLPTLRCRLRSLLPRHPHPPHHHRSPCPHNNMISNALACVLAT